jgi:hypothetical protein
MAEDATKQVSGTDAIRSLIRSHLPGELGPLYDQAPSLSDPSWQTEFGRMLFSLFLKATKKAHAAKDPVVAGEWHALAKQYSEEIRKLKYLEAQQKDSGIPGSVAVRVYGLKRKGFEDG